MNHPIIANNNGQARYHEMLQEAANYRLENKIAQRHSITKLINTFISLFIS